MKKTILILIPVLLVSFLIVFLMGPSRRDKEHLFVLENKEIQCPVGQKGFDLVNNSNYTVDSVVFKVFANVDNKESPTYGIASLSKDNPHHTFNTFLPKKGIKPFCDKADLSLLPNNYSKAKFHMDIESASFVFGKRSRTIQ
jgi:hypothetical protein